MRMLLDILEKCAPNTEKWIYTILTGEKAGKKALLENGEIRWQSAQDECFFEEHKTDLVKKQEKGCMAIAGERIFAEHIGSRPQLVICGGGHVSIALIRVAKLLEMRIVVLEDRLTFANQAKTAGADQVICDSYEGGLAQITADSDTYFVIVTRGHRYDQTCVEQISQMPHAYIGMMGSKRRVAIVKQGAVEHGADPDVIRQVHAPIGLDIKAETPEEIAISILAEIIAEKGKRNSGIVFTEEILQAIKAEKQSGSKMLVTIISKKGSAPRVAGTKMIICQDGTTAGTIGGGCMEAAVIQRARALMLQPDIPAILFEEKLITEEAEKEGMVCGGILELFLEKI